jgi:AcrR family transcriptional regulator
MRKNRPVQLVGRGSWTLATAIALVLCPSLVVTLAFGSVAPRAAATTGTSATITPSLNPDRLGARAALTFSIRYVAANNAVPTPVRRSVLRLPAGLILDIPKLRSCSANHLRAHGALGCPPQSLIGTGHALVETHAGSQTIAENVRLWAYVGGFDNHGQPAFEILGQGYTPLERRVVFGGTVRPDRAPYGEALTISIPAVPTLSFEPDASLVSFSLTVGTSRRTHDANTVLVPSSCPPGGFPFAAEFTYANGSTGSASATSPCPGPIPALPSTATASSPLLAYACVIANPKQRPYKQVARAAAQERTREALLNAATEEFYAGRWQHASLELLAKKAGVTKQTLLRHFGTKEDLLLKALLRAYVEIRDQRWSAPPGNLRGVLDNLLDHYEAWGERSMSVGAFQGEAGGLDTFAQAAREFHYAWVDYAFGPWLESRRSKARARCRASLIALCDVHTWWTLSHDLGLARAEVHATLTDVIKGVLKEKQ